MLVFAFTAQAQKVIIKQAEVARIVQTLSADDMQGRKTFEPGNQKAARFIASEFKKTGLKPLPGLTGYEQTFQAYQTLPFIHMSVSVDY